MSKTIGKVIATEKNPSTMEQFYFWTRPEMILNPFDVVVVEHIQNSKTFGVVEEISHITDSADLLSDYIANDFGDVEAVAPTQRIAMNYVKARIIGNSENVYIPVFNNCNVRIATTEEVSTALGLSAISSHCLPCGYLEMYQGAAEEERVRLTVNIDARYLIGPEGAHLNISGISGLAAKTSYAMFLLKGIQDKCIQAKETGNLEEDEDVAFVIFNVKGQDLLAIDEANRFTSKKQEEETKQIYRELGMTEYPFRMVHYYYPFSDESKKNTYLESDIMEQNLQSGRSKMFKYEYRRDKSNLDLMFANLDDPQHTMESILNYINQERGNFGKLDNWTDFLSEVHTLGQAGSKGDKEISVMSWRKFERVVRQAIYHNPIFEDIRDDERETRLMLSLQQIHKNEVHVIDVAKLSSDMQSFVFGDVVRSLYELQQSRGTDEEVQPPKKIIVFIDELNKYASKDIPRSSPILQQILDIAERGRSLGIVLFGAEQFKSAIHARVTGNCSTFAYGRTNAIEIAQRDYSFVPSIYKNMMARLDQGEYIIQNPVFRSLLHIKFPRPIYQQFK